MEEFQTFPRQQTTTPLLPMNASMVTSFTMTTHHGFVFPVETGQKKTSFAVSAVHLTSQKVLFDLLAKLLG